MSSNEETNLITFKAISNFTKALGELYSKKQRSLALYCRLIQKTTIMHDEPMKKHINSFRSFCVANRDAITNKDEKLLKEGLVRFSDKVFINMEEIFSFVNKDKEDGDGIKEVIWKHILTISALVDPANKAKAILRETADNTNSGQEVDFITDIIDKVEQHVDPNANPMEAVTSIMQSGIFTDLISNMNNGLSDGSLDLGKLMGTVSSMVSTLGQQGGPSTNGGGQGGMGQGGDQAMNMLNTMMGSFMGGMQNMQNMQNTQNTQGTQGTSSNTSIRVPVNTEDNKVKEEKKDNLDDIE